MPGCLSPPGSHSRQISSSPPGRRRVPPRTGFQKRSRLPSGEFTRGGGVFGGKGRWVMVANVDYERSEEERERARSARLTSFMTDGKEGDENQRKFHSSSLRTQCPPVRLLRLVFGLVVLETLVSPLRVGLVALSCWPHCYLCVAWLQPLPHQFQG
ncbi:hypothetical protein P692DRAFT_201243931 [Suillus brevipes Sb2]|nr:hypothetical protein P692DRAFT_201243931 [Suillus brevipes Sb2]